MKSGIYAIINAANGKCYIGSGVDVERRFKEHRGKLLKNSHHSQHLQRAWAQYGEGAFAFVKVESVAREFLLGREQYWIDSLQSYGRCGYNVSPTAGSSLGMIRSAETRRKVSEAKMGSEPWNKGKKTGPQKPELVKRRIDPLRGLSRPEHVKEKMSKTKKERGLKPTPEAIAKSAEVRKRNAELRKAGLLPPLYDEQRKKEVGKAISEAKKAAKAAQLAGQLLNK